MKTLRLLLCAMPLFSLLPAQEPEPAATATDTVPLAALLSREQLDQLVGPIALYPDALIALILPAASNPTDIVLAARYLQDNANDLSQVENRAWDESVKSLVHYPEVLKWMDENLPWTKQLGEQFVAQPAEVMNSIQRLRVRAQANGALVNTPQQQVLADPGAIRIVPTDPEVIYVPRYDPTVVYVDPPYQPYYYTSPLIGFGLGWRVGSWLAFDFDWPRHTLWVGDRHRPWHGRHDWHRPVVPIPAGPPRYVHQGPSQVRPWIPPVRPYRPIAATSPAYPTPRPPPSGSVLPRTYGRSPGSADTGFDRSRSAPPAQTWRQPAPVRPPVVTTPVTVVSAPPAANPPQNPHYDRTRDRSRGSSEQRTYRTGTAPLPPAPPLQVAGSPSSARPTVIAAPPQHPIRSTSSVALASPPAYASSRTATAPAPARTYSPPLTRIASAPVAPPSPPPSHSVTAPAPAPAPDSHPNNPPPTNNRGAPSRRVLD